MGDGSGGAEGRVKERSGLGEGTGHHLVHSLALALEGVAHHGDEHIQLQHIGEEHPEDQDRPNQRARLEPRAAERVEARLLQRVREAVAERDLQEGEGCVVPAQGGDARRVEYGCWADFEV